MSTYTSTDRGLLAAVSVACVFVTALLLHATAPAGAGYTPSLSAKQLGDDYFFNHDFKDENWGSYNVDWQIQVVAWGRASIPRTEDFFRDRYPEGVLVSNKHGRLNENGAGWTMKPQAGQATGPPGCGSLGGTRYHYRDYAPRDASFYDPAGWGHFNVIATHRDYNDFPGCLGSFYGYSELVEDDMIRVSRGRGAQINQDYLQMGPYRMGEHDSTDNTHYWETDGRATAIRIP